MFTGGRLSTVRVHCVLRLCESIVLPWYLCPLCLSRTVVGRASIVVCARRTCQYYCVHSLVSEGPTHLHIQRTSTVRQLYVY